MSEIYPYKERKSTLLRLITRDRDEAERLVSEYEDGHTACCRGYVSQKEVELWSYSGRFGIGYALLEPRKDTNRYCWITYFTEKRESWAD